MFRKMFTMSFDDSTVQDKRFIELIDKYDLKATFNLNTGFCGQKHNIVHQNIEVCHDDLPLEEFRQTYRNHEIAVHTVTHPNLKKCDDERVLKEVLDNYNTLTEATGKEIIGMAYPCGGDCFDERVKKAHPRKHPRQICKNHERSSYLRAPY